MESPSPDTMCIPGGNIAMYLRIGTSQDRSYVCSKIKTISKRMLPHLVLFQLVIACDTIVDCDRSGARKRERLFNYQLEIMKNSFR